MFSSGNKCHYDSSTNRLLILLFTVAQWPLAARFVPLDIEWPLELVGLRGTRLMQVRIATCHPPNCQAIEPSEEVYEVM